MKIKITMLRPSFINEIHEIIDSSNYFSIADFTISQRDENRNTMFSIQYNFDDSFIFSSVINENTIGFTFKTTYSPGIISTKETHTFADKDDFAEGIHNWIKRVQEEISLVPINRKYEEQKNQIDDLISQCKGFDDKFFTKPEADDLIERLDNLEAKLIEIIKESDASQKDQEREIGRLDKEVELLKSKLETHSKKGWITSFASASVKWLKDPANRKALVSTANLAQELMLEASQHLDTSSTQ